MEEQLVNILNEMADYLNISQMKRLQEVLLKNLCHETAQKEQISNNEFLKLFLDAKKIEGCSPRTLRYYEVTVSHFLSNLDIPDILRDDTRITTGPGDIVLYSGDQIVVFYGSNTWGYTKLGKITGLDEGELVGMLGSQDTVITLSVR